MPPRGRTRTWPPCSEQSAGGAACAFGVSSGALIALGAAARTGARPPGRLVLFEPPFTGAVGHPQDPAHAARLADLLDRKRRADAVAYFLGEIIGLPPESVAGARRSPAWGGLTRIAHTLRYDTTSCSATPPSRPAS